MSRSKKVEESINNPLYSRIGRRIILLMVTLSSVVTLLTTLLQLSWDYEKEFSDVDQRHIEIRDVHASLLASSLWSFDLVVLQERLDGLVNLPKIDYLEVHSGNYTFNSGKEVKGNVVKATYLLTYRDPEDGHTEDIGSIYVESNAQEIYDYLIQQFISTLLLNAFKTLLVCSVMLFIFHASVNRRVFQIAQYLRAFNPRHPSPPLVLEHTRWITEKNDELDWLGEGANKISNNITLLYNSIKSEQERLADFTHVSSDWLWETNDLGQLIYCSEPMKETLGLTAVNGLSFSDIEDLHDSTGLHQAIARRNDFTQVEESVTINSITLHLLFQAKARYENSQFLGFRGTAINITELKLTQIELEELNQNLERMVASRTLDLKQSMEQLQETQDKLVESEKLAALGGLVAGVAHEVNTPLGIAVTATSVIRDVTSELNAAFAAQTLTSTQFETLMKRMSDSSQMLEHNLSRAAKLVKDFKQTAVDQVSEARSQFNVVQVLEALLASLHPETRKIPVEPRLAGDRTILMNSLPGVLTQIISNLVMNSINHAFDNQPQAEINISFYQVDESIIVEYRDNGSGVDASLHQKIFEPFYTSKRGLGGSGLGLNLVFNLVKQKLQGELEFNSQPGEGVYFKLTLPENLPMENEH
ncbi:ATP-binding protein [Vibrio coralliilyticus]|uniref:sensor histidine kinase n=1 Tax=Vibrio coralliilyticus TaxID=190893 RepID=UPI000512895A|nr:ATP-binding protein [Vibrio coralliilyticus]AIS56818.1 histidine kinase [Vibrio coralliilyticus]